MKKSRFTETQIVGILKEAEGGIAMADILRTHGISGATFYKWRSKYGGLEASELKRVKELEQLTCPEIFRPNAFRDNGSFNLRSRYEESTVFRRTDCSDIARGRS